MVPAVVVDLDELPDLSLQISRHVVRYLVDIRQASRGILGTLDRPRQPDWLKYICRCLSGEIRRILGVI